MAKHLFARSVLAALGLFFAFAASGYADDDLYHGSLCNLGGQTPVGQAVYNQFGVANVSTVSSLTVNCGGIVPFRGDVTIENVSLTVYDRNQSEDVVCTLRTVTLEGTATTTQTQRSSGASAIHQFLVFDLKELGLEEDTTLTTISLQCGIPPFDALGASHVTTYRVITKP